MKNKNNKGFTLIELLAVIVILGVIMVIVIPSMTGYIANSRKDTMLSSAQEFVSAAKTLLISENGLPSYKEAVIVPVSIIDVEKGGVSPFTNQAFLNNGDASKKEASYVLVYNDAANATEQTSKSYKYAVTLTDGKGNCLDLVSENYLTTSSTRQKRKHVKTSACTATYIAADATSITFTVDPVTTTNADGTTSTTGTQWPATSVTYYSE